MGIDAFDFVFNLIVNIYQGVIITYYLINTLGYKARHNKYLVYGTGIIAISVLLEIQTMAVVFEGLGIFALFLLSAIISIVLLEGKFWQKIIRAGLIVVMMVFVSILIGSIVGLFVDSSYLELVYNVSLSKYISMILVQLVIYVLVKIVIRHTRNNELGENVIYSVLVVALSLISIVTVVFLQKLVIEENQQGVIIYTCIVFTGIMLLVIASLIVYGVSEKMYAEKIRKELEIAVYKRQKYDLNQMNDTVRQVEKVKHELNKICMTTSKLLRDKNYEQAEEFLNKFYDNEVCGVSSVTYTDNVILNYILNTKISICKELNIDVRCVVNGSIDGIDDVDLHCIMTNLWDNAIEAVQNLTQKEIICYIFGSDDSVNIELHNTVHTGLTQFDVNMKTTKKEPRGHGYGLLNIKNTVQKYNGICEYNKGENNYLTCKVFLFKSFTTKNGRLRQMG